jgi:DnaJ-class molecular chaperone
MKKDFTILEISKVLMQQQLRKHRKKALEHHPDKILETNRQKKSSR